MLSNKKAGLFNIQKWGNKISLSPKEVTFDYSKVFIFTWESPSENTPK